jgi:hypothetical protein
MPRTYSEKFLIAMHQGNPRRIGVLLAKSCVKANLPAKYVAVALNVSRMSLYSWFRGRPIREKNEHIVEVFIDLVEKDMKDGVLPAKNTNAAREYIEEMIGKKLQ